MEEKTNTLAQQPTCEDLEQKIETLKKEIALLQESLATLQKKEKTFVNQKMEIEEELKNTNAQLEVTNTELTEFIEKYNQMVVAAEITDIELNQIFNTSGDAMWVIDKSFNVQRINVVLLALLNKTQDEAIGKKCRDLFSGSLCRGTQCPMHRLQKGEERVECDVERINNGTRIPFILTATPFRGFTGELLGIVEGLKDITGRKRMEAELEKANRELERLATIDGLTQVANWRRFNEYLQQAWNLLQREQNPLSLIMIDIDHFKLYNDVYGHLVGDDCLRTVAQAISTTVKRPADLVARYGGEEFAVLLPNTNAEGAVYLAEAIRNEVLRQKIVHARSPVNPHVTLSLGVSSKVPDSQGLPATLVETADQALYEAKKNGRNRVILKTL